MICAGLPNLPAQPDEDGLHGSGLVPAKTVDLLSSSAESRQVANRLADNPHPKFVAIHRTPWSCANLDETVSAADGSGAEKD